MEQTVRISTRTLQSVMLNWFGGLQMNNPARAAAQRRFTANHMLRLGGDVASGSAFEIGCGRGVGVEIILETFKAANVVAFDFGVIHQIEQWPKAVAECARVLKTDAHRASASNNEATSYPPR